MEPPLFKHPGFLRTQQSNAANSGERKRVRQPKAANWFALLLVRHYEPETETEAGAPAKVELQTKLAG